MTDKMNKIEVTAPLYTEASAIASLASALSLPLPEDRQPDLQYLTAIFVSSGMNKNGAVFLGSELVKARGTISDKAVDIEHDEQQVIGQITGSAFLNRDRSVFDAETASENMESGELDALDMDIGISAIIHKNRFPMIAEEVKEGKWMVSMEAYYRDYDIKVGDRIIPKDKAEEMGFDRLVGSVVQLKDGDKELGFHLVGRVLRDILFAGVGLVQNPANPRSVIMEAAALNDYVKEQAANKETKVINLSDLENLDTASVEGSLSVESKEDLISIVKLAVKEALSEGQEQEKAAQALNERRPGTCVSYQKYVYEHATPAIEEPDEELTQVPLYNPPGPGGAGHPGSTVVREHYCSLFDMDCSARPGNATLPECWRNVFVRTVREEIFSHEQILRIKRVSEGLVDLQYLLEDAKKFM